MSSLNPIKSRVFSYLSLLLFYRAYLDTSKVGGLQGLCPRRPQQGASPLHLLQEGRCPSALRAFTPRSPLGRGARVNLAPCGVAYGASHAARGRGRVRALLAPYPPSLRSVRYRSHPLQLHRGSIRRACHDVVSRFGVADRRQAA